MARPKTPVSETAAASSARAPASARARPVERIAPNALARNRDEAADGSAPDDADPMTNNRARSALVIPGERPAAQVAFEAGVVELFVDAAGLFGVPKSVAAIYGVLFASPSALSFAEINARLDFSNGSISQGLRQLREVGAVKEVSADTERAARFEPDTELRQLVVRFMEQRVKRQIEQGRSRLAGLRDQAKDVDPTDRGILLARVKKLQTWHDRGRAVLPMVKTFLKLGGG